MEYKEERQPSSYCYGPVRSSVVDYSRITPEAGMMVQMPSVMIPLSDRVPGRATKPSRTRVGDGGGLGRLLENMVGYLGFSGRRRIYRQRVNSKWRRREPGGAPLQASCWLWTCSFMKIIHVNFQLIPRNFLEQLFWNKKTVENRN